MAMTLESDEFQSAFYQKRKPSPHFSGRLVFPSMWEEEIPIPIGETITLVAPDQRQEALITYLDPREGLQVTLLVSGQAFPQPTVTPGSSTNLFDFEYQVSGGVMPRRHNPNIFDI